MEKLWSYLVSALFISSTLIGLGWFLFQFPDWSCIHLLPLMVGAVFIVGVPLLQHSHEHAVCFDQKNWSPLRGQILGTYNFRMAYWLERLFCDINLHIVHHISPKVPWYNIRPAFEKLKQKYPDFVLEYNLNLNVLKKIYQKPLVVLDSENDFYISASQK